MDDDICAISTALGVGAIAIIRVSGPQSIIKVNKIFQGKDLTQQKTHTIHYGYIVDGKQKIDEVLVSIMKAPKTYTTQDVVEINTHGSIATTNKILELLLLNGCRLAQGGEFTKRAFLNGRIDLVQAEAVGQLIQCESDSSRKLLLNQLSGQLSNKIVNLRNDILEILANIAVNVDYPEYEDTIEVTKDILSKSIKNVIGKMNNILDYAHQGKIIQSGINIALIGIPNVGKSSILNQLIQEDKAIVSDIKGTTRDTVEGSINLNGVKFNFIDTAGIRKTTDIVEQLGVEKTNKIIENSDLIILCLSYDQELSLEEIKIYNKIKDSNYLIFINKDDKIKKIDESIFEKDKVIYGNTKQEDKMQELKAKLIEEFNLNKLDNNDLTYMSNARQIALLKQSKKILQEALENTLNDIPVDIIEIDIKKAFDMLGEIIGQTYKDELLDELFSNFCLGK